MGERLFTVIERVSGRWVGRKDFVAATMRILFFEIYKKRSLECRERDTLQKIYPRSVADLPLCLNTVPRWPGGPSSCQNFFTMDFCLCGAILKFRAQVRVLITLLAHGLI